MHGAMGGHGRRMSLWALGTRIAINPHEGMACRQRVVTIVAVILQYNPTSDKVCDGGFSLSRPDHCAVQGRLCILREHRLGEMEDCTPKTSGKPVTSLGTLTSSFRPSRLA